LVSPCRLAHSKSTASIWHRLKSACFSLDAGLTPAGTWSPGVSGL